MMLFFYVNNNKHIPLTDWWDWRWGRNRALTVVHGIIGLQTNPPLVSERCYELHKLFSILAFWHSNTSCLTLLSQTWACILVTHLSRPQVCQNLSCTVVCGTVNYRQLRKHATVSHPTEQGWLWLSLIPGPLWSLRHSFWPQFANSKSESNLYC